MQPIFIRDFKKLIHPTLFNDLQIKCGDAFQLSQNQNVKFDYTLYTSLLETQEFGQCVLYAETMTSYYCIESY